MMERDESREEGTAKRKASNPKSGKPNLPPPAPNWKFVIGYLVFTLLMLTLWQEVISNSLVKTIPYSEFKNHIQKGEVVECLIRETEITGTIKLTSASTTAEAPSSAQQEQEANEATTETAAQTAVGEEYYFRTTRVEDPELTEELMAAGVKFVGAQPGFIAQLLMSWILPLGILLLIWVFLSRRLGTASESIMSFRKSKAILRADEQTGVTFNDVAGCEEAKFELQEVVDFLKNPKRYQALGAKIPKGVLLVGPPGTGKTLMAKAVAGEAGVPFYSISGSEFVEMFVGVGAARVRDLFQQAKANTPCIIFIDEIDTIGRHRGVHMGMVNDEREQTLNQLLVEMDGFEPKTEIILIGATNRPDVLDRALLRPGRFDRQVVIDSPDLDGREAILRVHIKGKPVGEEVNLRPIAQATPGFSGADLANTINEAALLAARRGGRKIRQGDLMEAIEKVVAGPERRTRRLSDEQKRRVAYHEVGHALVAAFCEHADPVQKISIVPRGRAALGYTLQVPAENQYLMTRSEILDRVRCLLGGRAAELVVYDEVSTGAQNDLERATALVRQMVCIYGMSERVGLAQSLSRQDSPFLQQQGDASRWQRDCSEETAEKIDREVRAMLDQAHEDAFGLLTLHREDLEKVVIELLEKESLDGGTFYKLIDLPQPVEKDHENPAAIPPPPVLPRQE
jgi:cell division protease FtsH